MYLKPYSSAFITLAFLKLKTALFKEYLAPVLCLTVTG